MDGYDFDGYDEFSTYNGDTVHDMWVDDMFNAGGGTAYVRGCDNADKVAEDEPVIDCSQIAPHLQKHIDDCGNIDINSLLHDCLNDVGFYDC